MSLILSPQNGKEIDSEILEIYKQKLGGGELSQLAKLFKGKGLPDRLLTILRSTLRVPVRYYREELEIKLAWIDKRPLAKLANQPKRGELGDAAFFYFEILQHNGKASHQQARALIMQAKVAKEPKQIASPTVPVNPSNPSPNSSTAREIDLMSQWRTFDLYKTSRSRSAIVKGVSIAPQSRPPAHGWYMATPGKHPKGSQAKAWESPWMCGPAAMGAPCAVTLGELLRSFFTFDTVTAGCNALPEAGATFKFDPSYMTTPVGNGWDRLCVEILRLCPNNQLPKSLFGNTGPRGAVITSVVRSFPYLGRGDGPPDCLSQITEWLWPRRMPVLLVVMTKIEGESPAS